MPVKVKYTSTILKQGYHSKPNQLNNKFFNDELIGMPVKRELFADNEYIAVALLAAWQTDYYSYELSEVIDIRYDFIPNEAYVYQDVHHFQEVHR